MGALKGWQDSPEQRMFKLEPFSNWSTTKHARTDRRLFKYMGFQELRSS